MKSLDDKLPAKYFPDGSDSLSPEQRWQLMSMAIKEVLSTFVDVQYPPCSAKEDDRVRAYAKEVMSLGLLLMEFIDSIREGDGTRIVRCWRYFLPLFKACGRKNYCIEAFNLLFQYEYAFTDRMRHQLMWERTINTHGRPGKNVSMDLHMEHINRACKEAMGSLRSNISDKSVDRVGKCISGVMKITKQFDAENSVPQVSGRHSKRSMEKDMKTVMAQLMETKVYDHVRGRKHKKFKNIQQNSTRKLKKKDLEAWMKSKVQQYKMTYV